MLDNLPGSVEHIKAGALRALGVTTLTRFELLPDVPPIADAVPGYEASSWIGFVVPRGAPAEIVETLNREINAGLIEAKVKARTRNHADGEQRNGHSAAYAAPERVRPRSDPCASGFQRSDL